MVETARFFMRFTQNESCGKCVPCREGTKRMLEILDRIIANEGSLEDLDLLQELSKTISETALCGLGQSACKPVQSTLRHFRQDYLRHVVDHHCPICNGRKRRLVIKPELCKGCGKCKRNCPMEAISGEIRMPHTIDNDKCIHCGVCASLCPMGSINPDDVTEVVGVCIKCHSCVRNCPMGAKYFDDPAFLSHRAMLERDYTRRAEDKIFTA